MKKLLYILFLISSVYCFGQQTFQITDAEFQFIYLGGVIAKKDSSYFSIELNMKDGKLMRNDYPLTKERFTEISNDNQIVYKNQIDECPDFSKLNNLKFYEEDENTEFYSYKLNSSHFVNFSYDKDEKQLKLHDFLPFAFVQINEVHLIYILEERTIIYQSDNHFHLSTSYTTKPAIKAKNNKTNSEEMAKISSALVYRNNPNEIYKIEKTENNQYQIRNIFGDRIIEKEYDTIFIHHSIIGKNKKDMIYIISNMKS